MIEAERSLIMMTYAKRVQELVEKAIHATLFATSTFVVYGFVLSQVWALPVDSVRVLIANFAVSVAVIPMVLGVCWLLAWVWIFIFLVVPTQEYKTIIHDPFKKMFQDIKPLHVHLLANFLLELEMRARVLARVSKEKNELQSAIGAICSEKNIEIDSSEIEISMRDKLQSLEKEFQRKRAEFFERVRHIWDEAIPGWGIELIIPDRPTQWKDALRFKEWIALKHPTLLSVPFVKRFAPEQSEVKS